MFNCRFTNVGRRAVACGLTALLAFGAVGCGTAAQSQTESGTVAAAPAESGAYVSVVETSDLFSDRDLDPSYDSSEVTATITLADGATSVSGSGVTVDADIVTITAEGIYEVSGTLSGGQLRVDAPEGKVQIVLKDASITGGSSAAIYVKEAKKVFVTLAEDTTNKLVTSGEFVAIDENDIDGVLFSKDGLTINGTGSLSVSTDYGHGIVAKDELTLVSSNISVDVSGDAVKANDGLAVKSGSYSLACDGKALEVSNSDDATAGFVYVEDGSFIVSAVDDALNATGAVQVDGGTWDLSTGGDGIHSDSDLVINGGEVTVKQSNEGLEASTVTLTGGEVDVTSSDDGVNAVGTSGGSGNSDFGGFGGFGGQDGQVPTTGEMPETPDGQSFDGSNMPTPPDGMGFGNGQMSTPPDGQSFGDGNMPTPPEGTNYGDDNRPTPPNGQMPSNGQTDNDKVPSDSQTTTDGNSSGTTDSTSTTDSTTEQDGRGFGGRGGFGGGPMMDTDDTAKITVTGGLLTVNAGGDGLDTNGSVSIEGGETYVSGSTNGGNAALDFGLSGTISGGTFVATGMSTMAETFSSDSTQASAAVFLESNASGAVALKDSTGKQLVSYDAPKEFNTVIVSSPDMSESGSYTLTTGSVETEVAMSGVVTTVGTRTEGFGGGRGGGGFGGGNGGMGGRGGKRSEGQDSAETQMTTTSA